MATATKELPILFSGPMVRAILDGRKCQTRRMMKPHPEQEAGHWYWQHPTVGRIHCANGDNPSLFGKYQVGDRLWVRESFYIDDVEWVNSRLPKERPAELQEWQIYYAADGTCCQQIPECQCASVGKPKWRPSIFMPRWASRIKLEVTEVRVQQLQMLCDFDICDEGVEIPVNEFGEVGIRLTGKCPPCNYHRSIKLLEGETLTETEILRAHFASLWDTINGEGSWAANPWVWAITFQRV